MELPHHCSDSLFVITNDVGSRISGLRSLGLKTPAADDFIFRKFHENLAERISRMLPEVKVVTYDMNELVRNIWAQALKLKADLSSAVVVSTCAELAETRRGHIVEMNRIVDVEGSIIGFGPRPGAPLIGDQIAGIAEIARGKSVVVAEDGAFSGKTINYLVSRLAKHRIEVAGLVVGICFPKAVESIRRSFNGKFIVVEETEKPFEWMPDHDFLPFVPNCGRVFGTMFGNEGMPCYTHDGVSFSFPYILPFGDPVNWASIPQEHAVDFSLFCLRESLALFRILDEMNGRPLKIRDIMRSTPRVSMPMTRGRRHLPNAGISISGFLSEVCHEF